MVRMGSRRLTPEPGGQGRPLRMRRGRAAESAALTWLTDRGLRYVARNVRCRMGEIDLVLMDRECLVFVEVRYRKAGNLLNAVESIGAVKQRRLIAAASWFLARNPGYANREVRFDVVAIDGRTADEAQLRWLPDAFRPRA